MEKDGHAPADGKAWYLRFSVLQGILPVHRSQVPTDVIAGVTLAALAIPEVMGYTKIAGTPVITGLYTILLPIALFALFGSSRHLVVGADSATAAILAGGLVGVAAPRSAEWLALAGVLALLAAAVLAIARVVGLGFLANFLSRTVLVGFLTGVGVQVALGEISGMLGLPGGGHGVVERVLTDLRQIDLINPYDLVFAAAVIGTILGSKWLSKKIPGALIAVIGAIVTSWALDVRAYHVDVVGSVPSGLPTLGLPRAAWSWDLVQRLLPTAFAMSIVILAQSAATSRAYAARHRERLSEKADLVGLALANLGAGLSGAFVVNGSPTKTQMVESAGGRSQLSHVTTSVIVLLVLLVLTRPLAYMPVAVLSAVVFLIGIELIDIRTMRTIFAERPSEFWVAAITAGVVIFVGVEQGILLAMVLSLLNHVRRGYRPKNAVFVPDTPAGWRTVPVTTPGQLRPGLLVYRFNHSMYYANAQQLSDEVLALVEGARPSLSSFCIDAAAVDDVDWSAAATLRTLQGILKQQNVRLVFIELADNVHAELDRYGIVALLTRGAFYRTLGELVSAHDREMAQR